MYHHEKLLVAILNSASTQSRLSVVIWRRKFQGRWIQGDPFCSELAQAACVAFLAIQFLNRFMGFSQQ